MKNYTTTLTRPNTSVVFPKMPSVLLNSKMIGNRSEISDDLLTLSTTYAFFSDTDALEFSQDPVTVAFVESMSGTDFVCLVTQFN